MTAQRALILLAGTAFLSVAAAPASAQIADDVVLNIMRECARIDDPTARLACYDNNIRSAGAAARNTIPGETVVERSSGAPLASSGASGFGREDVRTADRFRAAPPGELAEITATVSSVTPREPGIYLITLEDGAQWLFSDSVGPGYRLPRSGSQIEIRRGALGGFLMSFGNQQVIGVRRVR